MQPSLLPIAILAMAAWAVAFVTILVATRPKISEQATSTSNWADLSPAIVALLCSHDGKVPDCAVTATFVDLIMRGHLKRSAARSGQARIEIAGADRSTLKPYEHQVFEHVAARARIGGGAVLEAALRLESSEHAKRWMSAFADQVIAEARQRRLVEERVSLSTLFWLWLALLVAVVLLSIAAIGTFASVLIFFVLAQPVTFLRGERPTEAGSRLVPMYRALGADQPAISTPPNDRKAAYVAALGNGGERSPFAHRDGHEVWSNRSGQWRKVRIIDPPVLFHGTDPVAALYAIPGALVFFGIWARLLYGFTINPQQWSVPEIVLAAGWLIFVLLNFLVWRFVYRGLYDLSALTVHVEGQVIYLDVRVGTGDDPDKTYHVAIDDGRNGKAIKHQIDQALFEQLRYGDWLRLEVTPKLRCVRSTSVVPAPSSP